MQVTKFEININLVDFSIDMVLSVDIWSLNVWFVKLKSNSPGTFIVKNIKLK